MTALTLGAALFAAVLILGYGIGMGVDYVRDLWDSVRR